MAFLRTLVIVSCILAYCKAETRGYIGTDADERNKLISVNILPRIHNNTKLTPTPRIAQPRTLSLPKYIEQSFESAKGDIEIDDLSSDTKEAQDRTFKIFGGKKGEKPSQTVVAPEVPPLSKHPLWKIHKYQGIDIRPVSLPTSYGPPKETYGPPKETYGPPIDTYGPPKETYAPPIDTYGPPKETYEPPIDIYGPPKETYGPPIDTYGPPKETYAPPIDTYGPPKETYGPPIDTYGPPVEVYGPPEPKEPLNTYGPPATSGNPSASLAALDNLSGLTSLLPNEGSSSSGLTLDKLSALAEALQLLKPHTPATVYGPPQTNNVNLATLSNAFNKIKSEPKASQSVISAWKNYLLRRPAFLDKLINKLKIFQTTSSTAATNTKGTAPVAEISNLLKLPELPPIQLPSNFKYQETGVGKPYTVKYSTSAVSSTNTYEPPLPYPPPSVNMQEPRVPTHSGPYPPPSTDSFRPETSSPNNGLTAPSPPSVNGFQPSQGLPTTSTAFNPQNPSFAVARPDTMPSEVVQNPATAFGTSQGVSPDFSVQFSSSVSANTQAQQRPVYQPPQSITQQPPVVQAQFNPPLNSYGQPTQAYGTPTGQTFNEAPETFNSQRFDSSSVAQSQNGNALFVSDFSSFKTNEAPPFAGTSRSDSNQQSEDSYPESQNNFQPSTYAAATGEGYSRVAHQRRMVPIGGDTEPQKIMNEKMVHNTNRTMSEVNKEGTTLDGKDAAMTEDKLITRIPHSAVNETNSKQ